MTRTILMVDDSEDDVFLMQQAWKKAGILHSLEVAEDGEVAINFLQTALADPVTQQLPCLVLLDMKMPRVNGLEVLEWIRKQPSLITLPVIMLTSSNLDKDIEAAYRLGANSYFAKPVDSNALYDLVKLFDEYWLQRCLVTSLSEKAV